MGRGFRAVFLLSLVALGLLAQPKRILYVTATAGFRHGDSIDASVEVMQQLAQQSGAFEVVHTEDLSLISVDNLRNFDAVYFFTSGELPLSDQQKADLLDFVRRGKGFGGSHSATDTLYSWADYGDLIGAYFDGHPWVQEGGVDVEDPQNPIVAHMAPSFRVTEEFYQFRNFSRDKVRVLLTLDTRSVDLSAPGVNRTDGDFALAWIKKYGDGRVFYSAFGHFPDNFRNEPFRTMLLKALLWLTGQIDADATPRSGPSSQAPSVQADGVRTLAGGAALAPGSLITIAGERLTSGSSLPAASTPLPVRLAGTHVDVNGTPAPLLSVTPGQVTAQLPFSLTPGAPASLTLSSVNRAGDALLLTIAQAAPEIVAGTRSGGAAVLYAVGLGATNPMVSEGAVASADSLARTVPTPAVRIGGQPATVLFSGLAPGWVGLYQVNALLPDGAVARADGRLEVTIEIAGNASPAFLLAP
jgi:uncharacterized protein (TIGR03437 family)